MYRFTEAMIDDASILLSIFTCDVRRLAAMTGRLEQILFIHAMPLVLGAS